MNIWENEGNWPKPPRQYVFLAVAFNEVGRAMYADEWTGREALPQPDPWAAFDEMKARKRRALDQLKAQMVQPAARVRITSGPYPPPKPPPKPVIDWRARVPRSAHVDAWREELVRREAVAAEEAARAAIGRREAVAAWIADKARNEEVESVIRPAEGGIYQHARPDFWNVEPDWRLFMACRYRAPLSWDRFGEFYIFLTRESLDRQLAVLRGTPLSRPGRRKGAGSLAEDDAALLDEMRRLIAQREVASVYAAAERLAPQAKGSGAMLSKTRRLERRYLERFRAQAAE